MSTICLHICLQFLPSVHSVALHLDIPTSTDEARTTQNMCYVFVLVSLISKPSRSFQGEVLQYMMLMCILGRSRITSNQSAVVRHYFWFLSKLDASFVRAKSMMWSRRCCHSVLRWISFVSVGISAWNSTIPTYTSSSLPIFGVILAYSKRWRCISCS